MTHPNEAPRLYPTFRYRDAALMIDWLEEAFGFVTRVRHDDGARVAHAEMALGASMIMLGSAQDDAFGDMVGWPGVNGGKSVYVAVDDADALHARARVAGAEILMEPTDRPHGSRDFICKDPEGNIWCFGTYWPKAGDKPDA